MTNVKANNVNNNTLPEAFIESLAKRYHKENDTFAISALKRKLMTLGMEGLDTVEQIKVAEQHAAVCWGNHSNSIAMNVYSW